MQEEVEQRYISISTLDRILNFYLMNIGLSEHHFTQSSTYWQIETTAARLELLATFGYIQLKQNAAPTAKYRGENR